MKKKLLVLSYLFSIMVIMGCSKSEVTPTESPSLTQNQKLEFLKDEPIFSNVQLIAKESNPATRARLVLRSMTNPIESSNAATILQLHTENKLSNEEFRALFWNSSISSEVIASLINEIQKNDNLTSLDSTIIQSIFEKNISFDALLDELKKDKESTLPAALQTVLLDELASLYLKDFDNINQDRTPIHRKLEPIGRENTDAFLKQLKKFIDLLYFKDLLSKQRLVTPKNPNVFVNREIKPSFNFDYSFTIGRCGTFPGSLKNFVNLTDAHFGKECPTTSASIVKLDLETTVTNASGATNISVLLHSFVKGGYDKSRREDGTSYLSYNLAGQLNIPKCSNPSFCNQLVSVAVSEFSRIFPDSDLNNGGVTIDVNGVPLTNAFASEVIVDISKQDAVINIRMTGYKKHIGHCCTEKGTFQKVNLVVSGATPGFHDYMDLMRLVKYSTLKAPDYGLFNQPLVHDLNSPSPTVTMVERELRATIENKDIFDDYRSVFYNGLARNQFLLNSAVKANAKPVHINNFLQIQSALSDRLGRNLVLPIVISKQTAYENASTLNIKQNINELIKSILLVNLNTENHKEEVRNLIDGRLIHMSSEAKELAAVLLDTLEQQNIDQKKLLQEISQFQTDVSLMLKRSALEIEVLNLERAQFEDVRPEANKLQVN